MFLVPLAVVTTIVGVINLHCVDIDLLPVTENPVEPENLLWRR